MATLAVGQALVVATPTMAQIDVEGGVRYGSASYGTAGHDAVSAELTVVDVVISKAFGRHRPSVELSGIAAQSRTTADAEVVTVQRRVTPATRSVPPPGRIIGELPAEPLTTERQTSGIGDIVLGLDSTWFGGGAETFTLLSILEVKAPVADRDDRLGTGEWDFRIGGLAERRFWSYSLIGELGYNVLGDMPELPLQDVWDVSLGIESSPWRAGLIGGLWLDASQEIVAGLGAPATLTASIAQRASFPWRLEVSAGLTEASEDFGVSFHLGVSTRRRRW